MVLTPKTKGSAVGINATAAEELDGDGDAARLSAVWGNMGAVNECVVVDVR